MLVHRERVITSLGVRVAWTPSSPERSLTAQEAGAVLNRSCARGYYRLSADTPWVKLPG